MSIAAALPIEPARAPLSRSPATRSAVAARRGGARRSSRRASGAATKATGTRMPDFALASLGGERVTPADFAGKVVLYDFWATWCGPCHLQADILRGIYPAPQAARRRVRRASRPARTPEVVREFVDRRPFPYAGARRSRRSRLGDELEILGLPTLVVIDAEGRIAYRHTGDRRRRHASTRARARRLPS